jgi:hypothetical protein
MRDFFIEFTLIALVILSMLLLTGIILIWMILSIPAWIMLSFIEYMNKLYTKRPINPV